MADGFETIGWILSVEDKATRQVEKITALADSKFADMGHSIVGVSDAIAEWGSTKGPFKKAGAYIGGAFFNVFATGAAEAADATVGGFTRMSEAAIGFTSRAAVSVTESMSKFGDRVRGIGKVLTDEYTFGDIADTFKSMFRGPADDAAELNAEVAETRFGVRGAAVESQSLAKSFFSIDSVMGGLSKMGGIAGVMLGPLAPLMKLFQPLLDMIVRQITPAMETFSAIVETAFAPLGMTLEIIARNVATKLLPVLAPFVSMLEIVAMQLGNKIVGALEGIGDSSGFLFGLFDSLFSVGQSLIGVATKILPIILNGVQQILPVFIKVVDLLAKSLVPVIDEMGAAFVEVLPEVVKLVNDLLKAFMPLIPPLIKLASLLLGKVFGPLMVGYIKLVTAGWMKLVPYIESFVNWLAPWIDVIAFAVDDFYSNFEKNMLGLWYSVLRPLVMELKPLWDGIVWGFKQFAKLLDWLVITPIMGLIDLIFVGNSPSLIDALTIPFDFLKDGLDSAGKWMGKALDTVMMLPTKILGVFHKIRDGIGAAFDWMVDKISGAFTWTRKQVTGLFTWWLGVVQKFWTGLLTFLGLDDVANAAKGIFGAIRGFVESPINSMKELLNYWVIDFVNDVLSWDPPVIPGGTVSEIVWGKKYTVPELAEGGVVNDSPGGTLATIGEGGAPEMVLPLRAETIERVLAPLIPEMEFPALEQMARIGENIERLLRTGTIRVAPVTSSMTEPRRSDTDNLGQAVGMEGMGW